MSALDEIEGAARVSAFDEIEAAARVSALEETEAAARVSAPAPGRYAEGAPVRVKALWPERHGPVHLRTPHYLRGAAGRVVRRLGAFPNPEDLAFGRPAAAVPLYHVLFDPRAVWPDASGAEVLVEVFEHWLEPRS